MGPTCVPSNPTKVLAEEIKKWRADKKKDIKMTSVSRRFKGVLGV